ncbi:MAG: DUF4062 domain-containing protein [Desulfobacteraceae bacterium]|nr:DUF4062 domain-containing protein [Desulfobacteraceae bacterium]
MNKTVFISSTYEDLKDYRRQLWETLGKYDVIVRGMEKFGARSETPLETCLSEVEQSDIFVCILAMKAGSIEPTSEKSYTQLEYEKAYELKREILVYIIDQANTPILVKDIDFDNKKSKLDSFKSILKERHTVDTFTSSSDLAEKLNRRFKELLDALEAPETVADPYADSIAAIEKFNMVPKSISGQEIQMEVTLDGELFPASKELCDTFNFDYGRTLGQPIKIVKPKLKGIDHGLHRLFLAERYLDSFYKVSKNTGYSVYAKLLFSEKNISDVKANFNKTRAIYFTVPDTSAISFLHKDMYGIKEESLTPEGFMILYLTKIIGKRDSAPEKSSG